MLKIIIFTLSVIFVGIKIYRHRYLFRQLTTKEWLQYIGGIVVAITSAGIIIIGGGKLIKQVEINWLQDVLAIIIVIIGLFVGAYILLKLIPKKLHEFYN